MNYLMMLVVLVFQLAMLVVLLVHTFKLEQKHLVPKKWLCWLKFFFLIGNLPLLLISQFSTLLSVMI